MDSDLMAVDEPLYIHEGPEGTHMEGNTVTEDKLWTRGRFACNSGVGGSWTQMLTPMNENEWVRAWNVLQGSSWWYWFWANAFDCRAGALFPLSVWPEP